jgi:MFS family permease
MSITADTAQREGALSHRQVLTILTGLLLGMFLGALDQTIVSTAIRRIGDDLHGLSAQAWVTTSFLITSTIATPLYGKLSDIYGRKPLFIIAITVFIIGSALSRASAPVACSPWRSRSWPTLCRPRSGPATWVTSWRRSRRRAS